MLHLFNHVNHNDELVLLYWDRKESYPIPYVNRSETSSQPTGHFRSCPDNGDSQLQEEKFSSRQDTSKDLTIQRLSQDQPGLRHVVPTPKIGKLHNHANASHRG